MLHTKFQVHEKKFLKSFYYIWTWLSFWSCYPDATNIFSSPYPRKFNIKFGYDLAVSKKMFKHFG